MFWCLYKILNSMGAGIDTQSTYDLLHQKMEEKKQYDEYVKRREEQQRQQTQNIMNDLASKRIKARHIKTNVGE